MTPCVGVAPTAGIDEDEVADVQRVGRRVEVAGVIDVGREVRRPVVPEREAVGVAEGAEVRRTGRPWLSLLAGQLDDAGAVDQHGALRHRVGDEVGGAVAVPGDVGGDVLADGVADGALVVPEAGTQPRSGSAAGPSAAARACRASASPACRARAAGPGRHTAALANSGSSSRSDHCFQPITAKRWPSSGTSLPPSISKAASTLALVRPSCRSCRPMLRGRPERAWMISSSVLRPERERAGIGQRPGARRCWSSARRAGRSSRRRSSRRAGSLDRAVVDVHDRHHAVAAPSWSRRPCRPSGTRWSADARRS